MSNCIQFKNLYIIFTKDQVDVPAIKKAISGPIDRNTYTSFYPKSFAFTNEGDLMIDTNASADTWKGLMALGYFMSPFMKTEVIVSLTIRDMHWGSDEWVTSNYRFRPGLAE
jgi:hypothetical protein